MTKQQARLLEFLKARIDETGVCPSYEEMKVELGYVSKRSIHQIILRLEEQGMITRTPHKHRTIRVSSPGFLHAYEKGRREGYREGYHDGMNDGKRNALRASLQTEDTPA